MSLPPLTDHEMKLIVAVFQHHPEVTAARLFGSRAKGTHIPSSDVDLAVWGDVDAFRAEAIAAELDELPLPYRFEVIPFALIKLPALQDHIQRMAIPLYSSSAVSV